MCSFRLGIAPNQKDIDGEVASKFNEEQFVLTYGPSTMLDQLPSAEDPNPILQKKINAMQTATPQLIPSDKLYPDGRYKEFRGNTIIAFVTEENNPLWYSALIESQKIVQNSPLADMHSMLPPKSFHVTIFDLITEPRSANRTEDLIGAPLVQVEVAMINRLRPLLIKERQNPSMYSFKYNGLYLAQGWSTFCLELTCNMKSEVDAYRQEVSRLTGAPYNEKVFHITIAYNRYNLPLELAEERNKIHQKLEELWKDVLAKEPELTPTKPYLTFFRDMTDFPTKPIFPENDVLLQF
jgi:hypothetical protein